MIRSLAVDSTVAAARHNEWRKEGGKGKGRIEMMYSVDWRRQKIGESSDCGEFVTKLSDKGGKKKYSERGEHCKVNSSKRGLDRNVALFPQKTIRGGGKKKADGGDKQKENCEGSRNSPLGSSSVRKEKRKDGEGETGEHSGRPIQGGGGLTMQVEAEGLMLKGVRSITIRLY